MEDRTMSDVHLVIEEAETGSFAGGGTYVVLSAHRTEAGAAAAVAGWRESHGEPPHRFEGNDPEEPDGGVWCSCGSGVSQEHIALED